MFVLDEGLSALERSASEVRKGAAALTLAAQGLSKAAKGGDLALIGRTVDRVTEALHSLSREVEKLEGPSALGTQVTIDYLSGRYVDELVTSLSAAGIAARRDQLAVFAFPVVIRVIPGERAVRIDGKKLTTIRPSAVTSAVKRALAGKPTLPPERFLEVVFDAYQLVSGSSVPGETVALSRIYQAITLMPGAAASYGPTEFARDLYALDRAGISKTKSGTTLAFTASTGTKSGRGIYTFITPDGERTDYHGIRFVEVRP